MAAATYEAKKTGQGKTTTSLKKYYLIESTVTMNDTITIAELTTVTAADIRNLDTGAAITCTVATNVITVTGAATAVKCIILVVGS